MSSAISLVIPTLNAESEIVPLLEKLCNQTRHIDEIVVVDSASDDRTVEEASSFAAKHIQVSVHSIERKDFRHGGTRDLALREWTTGDFVLFMTQDAVPADDRYVESILAPFEDEKVAVSSGRQLPKSDARRFERLVRGFNYPETSFVRGKDDLPTYGIKTFFISDVCSAYRRSAYLECGGFAKDLMMSEDMYMAAKLVAAGYLVAYAADAQVYHSHNLTPRQQYARNFAIGKFLEENKDILMNASEIGEGKKLAAHVAGELLRSGHIAELFAFGADCTARILGNRAGRRAAREDMAKGR
jgi:rhamnosyltransferase